MRYGKAIVGIAFALLLGLAAQPAHAQRRGGGGAPRYNAPRFQNHPRAAARAAGRANNAAGNRNPYQAGGGANTFRPPRTYQPGPQENRGQSVGVAGARPSVNSGQTGNEYANRPAGSPTSGTPNGLNANGSARLPGQWAQKLGQMSPQQQEHFLQNNERFRNMPPERQQQIRQNLENYNRLSPTEKMAMKDRQAAWERMSPEQRQYVQKTLLPRWQQMSPERKQVVTDRLHTLQGMTPEDRQKALNDPQFMRGLNPDEQSVLRGLDSIRNPSNP